MIPIPKSPPPAQFLQAAKYHTGRRGQTIKWLVVHTAECPLSPGAAHGVAEYFSTVVRYASAHYTVDSDSVWQSVHDADTAYGVPGANECGLHIEHACYAADTAADWSNGAHITMLGISALIMAHRAWTYGIPIVHLTSDEIRAGKPGFVGHVDLTNAINHGKGHQDPGPNFPWEEYLAAVKGVALKQIG